MAESQYLKQEMEQHPEPEYLNDLRILRRFVQNGSFGYHQSEDLVFQRLKPRYPRAYSAFVRNVGERPYRGTNTLLTSKARSGPIPTTQTRMATSSLLSG